MSTELQNLFRNTTQSGMSRQSVDLLIQNLDGQAALGCIGAQIDELNTDDVTLVALILDESSSMENVRNDVIDAFNTMTRALADSKSRDSILLSAWKFSDESRLLFNYTPIEQVKDLTLAQYAPNGMTALYDATLDGITGAVGYGQDLRNAGIRTRSIIVVLSDGGDNSSRTTAANIRAVSEDLIKQEIYTLAFIGLGDEAYFSGIASGMGFPEVITSANTGSEIRKALHLVSGSVIRASQNQINSGSNSFFSF